MVSMSFVTILSVRIISTILRRRKPDGPFSFHLHILKETQTQTAEEKFLCVREENNTQILNLSGPTLTLSIDQQRI